MITAPEIRESFESAFRQYYPNLCSYANTFLKDPQSSEDLVQEVFIKVWENQKMQLGADKIKFYLFTAVRNNCLSQLQKNKKHLTRELQDNDAAAVITLPSGNEEKKAEPKTHIANALQQLPPKCREVFMLSRISGLTYQQIADTLDISKKTVENQMGKAISMMKVFVKENGIYLVLLQYVLIENDNWITIGVCLEKWFIL